MPDREANQRYHELIDERFARALTAAERFELERIEERLDAGDRNPVIEAQDREWEAERSQLLNSIRTLLERIQS